MKHGLSASLILHAAALGFGLFSLSAPKAFDVADVESLPVDMVSITEYTQIVRGDRKADLAETPSPRPTERKEAVPDAVNVGDNLVDLDNPPTPAPRPVKVETAAASAEPEPVPAPKPEPEPQPAAEPTPPPQPEPEPEPVSHPAAQEAVPEPAPQPAETPEAEALKLPDVAPVPQAKPKQQPKQQQQQQVAQKPNTPERSAPEMPKREAARSQDSSELDLDEVAALIDRAKASGGGAKRSDQQAALGNRQHSEATQLSQSELDALRSQLENCWNPPVGTVGSSEFTASVKFQVDVSRRLSGSPEIIRSSGNRQFDDSVIRAVNICNDRGFRLPEGKQSVWADIVVNFDPSGMY